MTRHFLVLFSVTILLACAPLAKYPEYGHPGSVAEQFIDYAVQHSEYRFCAAAVAIPPWCGTNRCNVDSLMSGSQPNVQTQAMFNCNDSKEQAEHWAHHDCTRRHGECLKGWYRDRDTAFVGSRRDESDPVLGKRYAASQARKQEAQQARIRAEQEAERERLRAIEQADEAACVGYGFKPGTSGYASCRMQVDLARREMQQQQEVFSQQQLQYQLRLADQEAARQRQRSAYMTELGLRMMGGQSPLSAASSIGTGAPISAPVPPPTTRFYRLPNGQNMTCTTMGNVITCH